MLSATPSWPRSSELTIATWPPVVCMTSLLIILFRTYLINYMTVCDIWYVVCSARLRHTWWIFADQSPTSPVGSIYVRLAATSSSFHATVARSSAVGPSLLRVRWPGTHCQTASEIRLCQPALSDVIWRLFFSPFTSVPAHWRLCVYAIYKSTTDTDIDITKYVSHCYAVWTALLTPVYVQRMPL